MTLLSHVGLRIVQRIAHAGLRGQMHDPVEALGGEQRRTRLRVADIEAVEGKARMRLQPREACLLELGIVIVVEVVDADDLVIALEQPLRDMHADEAGSSGDQNLHLTNGNDARMEGAYCSLNRTACVCR